jgi:hypothetical protein
MTMVCKICNHPRRLEIDREIVQGKSRAHIARQFGVSGDSVGHHREHHLSRQLTQAWTKKEGLDAVNLMAEIEEIIGKAKDIFNRNYEAGRDLTALKALAEQRGVLDLLLKVATLFHEARLLELQNHPGPVRKGVPGRATGGAGTPQHGRTPDAEVPQCQDER